jgi:hypothetical protein
MKRTAFTALVVLGIALLALTACSGGGPQRETIRIQQNNNAQLASPTIVPPPSGVLGVTGFLDPSNLEQSVAHEQAQALAAAPASEYDSTDDAPISVSCENTGTDTFTCTGSDTDGDTGAADDVTVAADGASWSDSGMTWTGPDVSPAAGTTVDPVTDWSAG